MNPADFRRLCPEPETERFQIQTGKSDPPPDLKCPQNLYIGAKDSIITQIVKTHAINIFFILVLLCFKKYNNKLSGSVLRSGAKLNPLERRVIFFLCYRTLNDVYATSRPLSSELHIRTSYVPSSLGVSNINVPHTNFRKC